MLKNRRFNIVRVKQNRAIAGSGEVAYDAVVNYSGKKLKVKL